jgi:hypothetical protein
MTVAYDFVKIYRIKKEVLDDLSPQKLYTFGIEVLYNTTYTVIAGVICT